jgi:hypothetical protein
VYPECETSSKAPPRICAHRVCSSCEPDKQFGDWCAFCLAQAQNKELDLEDQLIADLNTELDVADMHNDNAARDDSDDDDGDDAEDGESDEDGDGGDELSFDSLCKIIPATVERYTAAPASNIIPSDERLMCVMPGCKSKKGFATEGTLIKHYRSVHNITKEEAERQEAARVLLSLNMSG